MKEINQSYVAGFLDNVGCFYVKGTKNRGRVSQFSIRVSKTKEKRARITKRVLAWLRVNTGIVISVYECDTVWEFKTTKADTVLAIIKFYHKNCYIKPNNIDDAREACKKKLYLARERKRAARLRQRNKYK